MKRYFIMVGDKTTRNGVVIEGELRARNQTTPFSTLGSKVHCPACKTTGVIVGAGPSRRAQFLGKLVALDGDLCRCECDPPPRLIASQRAACISFDAKELSALGYDHFGNPLPVSESGGRFISFQLVDDHSLAGLRCIAHFNNGLISTGTIDADNRLHIENPAGSSCRQIEFGFPDSGPSSALCDAFIQTLASQE